MVELMMATAFFLLRCFCALVLGLCGFLYVAHGQQEPTASEQADDVLRINADLAQTDVMVFDKDGRFVENLKADQFELKIDGKPKPITFFEFLQAGGPDEDAQLAAARGNVRTPSAGQRPGTVVPLDRGRVVLFFVDDLHLAADSMQRVRSLLEQFIENDFGQNDRATIMTGSGQLGFLEQVTSDKTVLLTAISRLHVRTITNRDSDRPPMSELLALAIARFDPDVTDFFVERFLADNPGFSLSAATEFVRNRALGILQLTGAVTKNSLQSLYSLIRYVGEMPERKLLFFISDGFLIDDQTTNISASLRRITDAAARAGVVVYSIDARGLSSGMPNSESAIGTDLSQRLTRTSASEITSTQAPLRSLSTDTGGRALLNTNALSTATSDAVKETAAYYVLAWRPGTEQEANKFRRIEVGVVGHPELSVRVRRGFLEREARAGSPPNAVESGKPAKAQSTDAVLLNAMQSRFPLNALPTSLFVSFANDKVVGSYVTISMEMGTDALAFTPMAGKQAAIVDVAGIVFDDHGKPATSFKAQVTVNPPATSSTPRQRSIAFNHQARLKPGLYQIRVAASDNQSRRLGSAIQWIEVPDLTLNRLSLSTVTVGERATASNEAKDAGATPENVFLSISRRLARGSNLRFLTYIYNAARGAGAGESPDIVVQVHIFRDNQPVLTTTLSKVNTEGVEDMTRLPYAADIPLKSMPAGRYRLQVTAIDRIAKTSATQHVSFEVG